MPTDRRIVPPAGLSTGVSRISGSGLFTSLPRAAGDRVAIIDGEVISGEEAERRDGEGNVYIYELTEESYLDAAGGIGRLVNHSCEPTCSVEERDDSSLWLVALRDLPAGSELTIDYDYPEIVDACRAHNPACLGDRCPRAAAMLAEAVETVPAP